MKKLGLIWILSIVVFAALGQCDYYQRVASRAQAIRQGDYVFYEMEGYQISSHLYSPDFDTKNIKKFKRKLSIPKKSIQYNSSIDGKKSMIFRYTENLSNSLKAYYSCYLVEKRTNSFHVVSFSSINKQDSTLEREFVSLLIDNHLPGKIFISPEIDSIDFNGRNINLGNSCQWMGVHNIQCPYYGQMNWSLHESIDDAKIALYAQYQSTKTKKLGEVLTNEKVKIVFDGVETDAMKVIYKIKIPKFIMGGSNTLIIYYVAEKVRNNYISCVLSFYTNSNIMDGDLPPLLDKVMKLKK